MFNLSKKAWVIIAIVVLFVLLAGASIYSSYQAGKIQSSADQPIKNQFAGYGYGYGGDLALHYKFEQTVLRDFSKNKNNGKNHNVKFNANFDGTSTWVDAGNSPSLRPEWITIAAWIKPNGPSQKQDQIVTQEDYGYRFSYAETGVHLVIKDPDADQKNQWGEIVFGVPNTVKYIDGEWNYVVATYGSDRQIKIYVDGQLMKVSQKFTGGDGKITYQGGTKSTTIGYAGTDWEKSNWRTGFNGSIGDIKIWNKALDQNRIKREYNEMASYFGRPLAQ